MCMYIYAAPHETQPGPDYLGPHRTALSQDGPPKCPAVVMGRSSSCSPMELLPGNSIPKGPKYPSMGHLGFLYWDL